MKILIIGATGAVGNAVVKELKDRHDIIIAARSSGDVRVDIGDVESIIKMYQSLPMLDAVIATTGKAHFAPLTAMTAELYQVGIFSKLLGQVNLVLEGIKHMNTGGSFTLTTGIANRAPFKHGSSAAMVNGALDGFVKSAATELPNALRINAVSPTVLTESMGKYADFFRGFKSAPAADVALAYSRSVEGGQTGKIYQVGDTY